MCLFWGARSNFTHITRTQLDEIFNNNYQFANSLKLFFCFHIISTSSEDFDRVSKIKRILQHRTAKSSHVHAHINNCSHYKEKFQEKFLVDPDNAPAEQLRSFLHEHLKILEKGLHNTYHSKVYYGIFITINKPGINKQTEHNSSKILCRCIVPRKK